MATRSQLAWFEARSNFFITDAADGEEQSDDERYKQECHAVISADVARVGRVSENFEKIYTQPLVVQQADLAADSRRLLAFLITAAAARRSCLRHLLSAVPYQAISVAFDKRTAVTAVELAALPNPGSFLYTQRQLASSLRGLLGSAESDAKAATIPAAPLLLLLRYIVWVVHRVPEAVIALSLQFKTDVVQIHVERNVTRVEAITIVDAYRRARGHHPLALVQLQDAIFTRIKWSEMEDAPLEAWSEALRSIPIIDASLSQLQNPFHEMYEKILPHSLDDVAIR